MKRRRRRPNNKFIAMSKLLGVLVFLLTITMIVFSLYEMHEQSNLDSLPQLIISVFGLAGVYIAFYLTMAKWEHIEQEKTLREKEIIKLKKALNVYCKEEEIQEEINELEGEVQNLENIETELENEEIKPE